MSYYFDSKNGNHIIEVNNLGQYLNKNNPYFAINRKKFDLYFYNKNKILSHILFK